MKKTKVTKPLVTQDIDLFDESPPVIQKAKVAPKVADRALVEKKKVIKTADVLPYDSAETKELKNLKFELEELITEHFCLFKYNRIAPKLVAFLDKIKPTIEKHT